MKIREMALVSLFAALLAVSSQVTFPIGPVPHTLQILFIVMAGAVLGSRLGALSVIVWILLGVFGLPVFAQGKAGAAVLLGPTGGFLLGFLVCAYWVGYFTERHPASFGRMLIAMLTGLAAVYILGWMGFLASFTLFLQKPMTWDKAFQLVVLPFLPFDIVKALGAAYLSVRVKQALAQAGLAVNSHQK